MTVNSIGLNKSKSDDLIVLLNDLLSNYMIMYQNTRGFHWNINGPKFFELHLKFEELYTDFLLKIDEIAERVLTLGGNPLHCFEDYLSHSEIRPVKDTNNGQVCVNHVIEGFKIVILKQRHLLNLSSDLNDEGTNALMSDYIREQEKLIWMYSAYQQ
jgi:starvation-inducible DNA-binding protein